MPCSACVPATAGAVRMDKVFSGQLRGPLLRRAPRATWLYVGLACNKPPGHQLLLQVGRRFAGISEDGMDVLMTDLGDRYFVRRITATGKALVEARPQRCSANRRPPTRNN